MGAREFDNYSGDYAQLLKDPIRDLFSADGCTFFHVRKRNLILDYFHRNHIDTSRLKYLDLGCGKGELLQLLGGAFGAACGCDPSAEMLSAADKIETRLQKDPLQIPYGDAEFDFVTAVCVYHHVVRSERLALTREVRRALRPGGRFCIIEHNPLNPATQVIVRRTPVDANAVLLGSKEARTLMSDAGFAPHRTEYFLCLPERLYERFGACERLLRPVPLGGQYAVFAQRPSH